MKKSQKSLFIKIAANDKLSSQMIYNPDIYDAQNTHKTDIPFYLELAKKAKGPVLELGGFQSEYAKELLVYFEKYILSKESIELWKKHYKMFKEKC